MFELNYINISSRYPIVFNYKIVKDNKVVRVGLMRPLQAKHLIMNDMVKDISKRYVSDKNNYFVRNCSYPKIRVITLNISADSLSKVRSQDKEKEILLNAEYLKIYQRVYNRPI